MTDADQKLPEDSEERFATRFADVLATMRAEQRRCPAGEQMLALAEKRLGRAERESVMLHVAVCADCSELLERVGVSPEALDEATWRRAERGLDRRQRPWLSESADRPASIELTPTLHRASRPAVPARAGLLAAAAAVVGLVGAGAVWILVRSDPPPVSEERGSALQAIAPIGRVERLDAFEWSSSLPAGLRVRVEVERDGREIWRGETDSSASRLEVPEDLRAVLDRPEGGPVRWRVVGLSGSGAIIAESPWASLELATSPAP